MCLAWLLAPAAFGCGANVIPVADAAVVGDVAPRCASGLFSFEPAMMRSRDRYTYPAIARHREGFVFVTTGRTTASECQTNACVLVEELRADRSSMAFPHISVTRTQQQVRVFAGTDERGDGHIAAMAHERSPNGNFQGFSARRAHWASAPAFAPTTVELDVARGAMTVAFASNELSVLTHGWRPEGTVGEGSEYPVAPRVDTFSRNGAPPTILALDSTRGDYFLHAVLSLGGGATWLVTTHLFTRPGVANADFVAPVFSAGELRESVACDAALEPSGSTLVVCSSVGAIEVVRFDQRGVRTSSGRIARALEPGAPEYPFPPSIALTPDGEMSVVVTMVPSGVRLVALDRALRSLGEHVLPMQHTLGRDSQNRPVAQQTVLDLAASEGDFVLVASPSPSGGAGTAGETSPVSLTRFRVCR